SRFRRVFASDDPDKEVPDWKQLVWAYVKNPDIPIVAFERVAEKYPKRIEKVLRAVIGKRELSIAHLYAALLHYKQPGEGLAELEDEEQLWDLFNGNTTESKDAKPHDKAEVKRSASKPARPRTAERKARPAKKAIAKAAGKSAKGRSAGASTTGRGSTTAARKPGARRRS